MGEFEVKCRGCGLYTNDILVEGLGWMHWKCEVERLKGLYEESEAIQKYFVELMEWIVEKCVVEVPSLEDLEKYDEILQIIKDYKE